MGSFRHYFKSLHLWLGLSFGLLLSLVALAGGVLLFEKPLLVRMHPELARGTVPGRAELGHAMHRILLTAEGRQLSSLALPGDELPVFEGIAKNGDRYYFDPTDGRLLLVRTAGHDILLLLFAWHTQLLSGVGGKRLLGAVALAGLIMLGSGAWLYGPRWRRAHVHLKPYARPPIRRWASWHRMVGVFAWPLLLIAIGTGAALAYHDMVRAGVIWVFGEPPPSRPPKLTFSAVEVSWPTLLCAAHAAAPGAVITRIHLPVHANTALVMRIRRPGEWNPVGMSALFLDPRTARVVGGVDATRVGPGARLDHALFPIHSAAVGGGLWRGLLAMVSLAPVFMWITGLLFWRTRRRKARDQARRPSVQEF